jgi:hypothetical protein
VAAGPSPGPRPAVWSPGEHLVIDWGAEGGLDVLCAVLAWCRFRFVRFAADERAATTLALLAECFEVLGGVPGKVLADRMGCLKGGVVADVVVPTAQYVQFAGHYGLRPPGARQDSQDRLASVRDCERRGPQQAGRPPLTPENVAFDLRIRGALGGTRTPIF